MITMIIIIIIISIIIHYYSVLSYLAKSMSSIKNALLYADLPSFPSLSLITGDPLRPDLVLVLKVVTHYLEHVNGNQCYVALMPIFIFC